MQVHISYMEHLRKVIFVTDGGTHGKSPFGISQTMNISVQKMWIFEQLFPFTNEESPAAI